MLVIALIAGGAIYDIATTPRAVREYNAGRELSVVPFATSDGGGLGVIRAF